MIRLTLARSGSPVGCEVVEVLGERGDDAVEAEVPQANRIRGGASFGLSGGGSTNWRTIAVMVRTSTLPAGVPLGGVELEVEGQCGLACWAAAALRLAWSRRRWSCCSAVAACRDVGLNWTVMAVPSSVTVGGSSADPFGSA